MKVRPFAEHDVAAILTIQRQCPQAAQWREEDYLQLAGDSAGTILVAEIEFANRSEVAGFVAFHQVMDEAELRNLAVHPTHRRIGTGRALLEGGIRKLQTSGARRLFLEVRASNHPALAFYASAGFKLLHTRRDYYHDPIEDALVMACDIPAILPSP
jgi:ribosomal-protein-alanine N-acetyltransferase